MNIASLPDELVSKTFLYLQSPEAALIAKELEIYHADHSDFHTFHTRFYLVHSFMSFSDYYFNRMECPYDFDSAYQYPNHIHRKLYTIRL